jgi:UTP:GlnB (protein PII) uridylyltransferase
MLVTTTIHVGFFFNIWHEIVHVYINKEAGQAMSKRHHRKSKKDYMITPDVKAQKGA